MKSKPTKKRTPLAEARHQLKLATEEVRKVSDMADDVAGQLHDARDDLSRVRQAAERNALRVARLEGYIERVHEIERKQPVTNLTPGDPIDRLRQRIATGPEHQAQAILDALDSSLGLMDDIMGKESYVDR